MANKVKAVPITLDWDAFVHVLNVGAATLSEINSSGNSNPGRAMFQRKLELNGQTFESGHFKTGTSGARLYESNPDVVARQLLGEGQLAEQAVTSLGYCQLVAIYKGVGESMPREYEFAATVLGAYAKYNGIKDIDTMIVEPTATARKTSGVAQSEIDGIWS